MAVQAGTTPMIGLWQLCSVILIPLFLGMGLLRLIGVQAKSDPIAYPGLAWILGAMGTGLLMFFWLFTEPLPAWPLVPVLLALALALASTLLGRRYVTPVPAAPLRQDARAEKLLFGTVLALLLILTCARILEGTMFPVLIGDEADHWAMKTKLLWESGGFTAAWKAAMADPDSVYHKDYPLLNPLLQIWVHAHEGRILHVANRIPIQLFHLAGIFVLASGLRRLLRPAAAALFLCLAVAPGWSLALTRSGDGESMVGIGALVAMVYAVRAHQSREVAWTKLAFLGLAFLLWSKNESQLYLASLFGALVLWGLFHYKSLRANLRWKPQWLWALAPIGMLVLHHSFNRLSGIPSTFSNHEEGNLLSLFVGNLGKNGPDVLAYFIQQVFFAPSHSNLLFPLMLLVLVALHRQVFSRPVLAISAMTLLLAMLGMMAILVASPVDVHWLLATAAQRVSYQLYMCWLFWIALATHELGLIPAFSPRPLET